MDFERGVKEWKRLKELTDAFEMKWGKPGKARKKGKKGK